MRRTPAVLLGVALALALASANGFGRVTSGLILVFDQRPEGWTLRTKLRLLPTAGPIPVWSLAGTIHCDGVSCPGRRARLAGHVLAGGNGFNVQARFRHQTECTFAGTISDPTAENAFSCIDGNGTTVLSGTFHVGGCRCGDRPGVGPAGFCATDPCPF